jgi:DNA topoisomerase II
MKNKTITEFLSNEYKEFAFYSIESRAIASAIDGFKISQRKIIHVASRTWKTGNEKTLKVFQLSGKVASESFYHHGNSSLDNAIINLAQKFKNNAPLLEEDGQFGSLRSTESGAPRYIGTKLSKYFNMIYKDNDLLEFKIEEGEEIEPYYFLPIIPMILVNGTQGIAVGFASNILNRNLKDVIKNCQRLLQDKSPLKIKPHLNSFTGDWIEDKENPLRWIIRGKFTIKNSNTLIVNELPPSMTYEKYELHLDKLVDENKIVSYDDNCKDSINYVIKFKRGELEKLSEVDVIKLLKLEESQTENLTTLDHRGKLKLFSSITEIFEYFINFRLSFYEKRKELMLIKIKKEITIIDNRLRFISLIIDGKLKVNNVAKVDIIKKIEKEKFELVDDSYDYLLRMPIYSLTKEMYEKLKNEIVLKKEELNSIDKMDTKEMYIKDLEELLKKC